MTAPASQSDLQALLDEHARLILAIEIAATADVTASLAQQLGEIQRDIAAAWILTLGALDGTPTPVQATELRDRLAGALRGIRVDTAPTITRYAEQAAETAVRQARAEIGIVGTGVATPPPIRRDRPQDPVPTPSPEPQGLSDELREIIAQTDGKIQDRIDTAIERLQNTPPETFRQVTEVLSVANQARATAETATAWEINRAAAEAVEREAVALDAELLWVAERDACVACLAYSGIVSAPGRSFPLGLTYGKKPITPWPDPKHLPGPPLHNRCRCRLMLWLGHDVAAAAAALPQGARTAHVDYPAALRREADRSILRGFSVPSESERVRLRAAEKLLTVGVRAPESVKRYARGAIRRGGWPTRKVPSPPSTP